MTENEAIEMLDGIKVDTRNLKHALRCADMIEIAVKALEEVQQYRKIGTVEECREAVEKEKPKKCVKVSYHDRKHYKCPSCGKIQKTEYEGETFGCILNNCSNCGQKVEE